MDYGRFTRRGLLNAEFYLTRIAGGKPGETVAIVADDATRSEAELIGSCAKKLGLKPFLIDVSLYGISRFTPVDYQFLAPVKAAVDASDICITMCLSFAKILGSSKEMDGILTGASRRFALWARGIDEWDFDFEEIMAMRRRTPQLKQLLLRSSVLRITTAKGTDLTCAVGSRNMANVYEVLAITPFFAEVAIIPNYGTVNGTAVVDGAVSSGIRRNQFGERELGLEPIRLRIRDGVVADYQAAPLHRERLEAFIKKATPVADHIDEVGIVTCTASINDEYQWRIWDDGTHHSRSVHIALGNNTRERSTIVHAPAHADFDMLEPVLELDGRIIYQKGVFDDSYIEEALRSKGDRLQ